MTSPKRIGDLCRKKRSSPCPKKKGLSEETTWNSVITKKKISRYQNKPRITCLTGLYGFRAKGGTNCIPEQLHLERQGA